VCHGTVTNTVERKVFGDLGPVGDGQVRNCEDLRLSCLFNASKRSSVFPSGCEVAQVDSVKTSRRPPRINLAFLSEDRASKIGNRDPKTADLNSTGPQTFLLAQSTMTTMPTTRDGEFDTLEEILGASRMTTTSLDLDLAFGVVDSNTDLDRTHLLSLPPPLSSPLLLLLLLLGAHLRSKIFHCHNYVFPLYDGWLSCDKPFFLSLSYSPLAQRSDSPPFFTPGCFNDGIFPLLIVASSPVSLLLLS